MVELLTKLGKAHYIKRDLQPYLPAGYHTTRCGFRNTTDRLLGATFSAI
jgi:hypothetical protein